MIHPSTPVLGEGEPQRRATALGSRRRGCDLDAQAEEADWKAIVADLGEGVILIASDGRITFANDAALAMRGITRLEDLGGSLAGFHERYSVHDRCHHPLGPEEDPMGRAAKGESFADAAVRVAKIGQKPEWVFRVRSLVRSAAAKRSAPSDLLIVNDTSLFESEQRFVDALDPKRLISVKKRCRKTRKSSAAIPGAFFRNLCLVQLFCGSETDVNFLVLRRSSNHLRSFRMATVTTGGDT